MRGNGAPETFKVNFCPECKTPFERFWEIGKKKHQLYYYNILPSYGLKRKICPSCNGDIITYRQRDVKGLDERTSIKKIY